MQGKNVKIFHVTGNFPHSHHFQRMSNYSKSDLLAFLIAFFKSWAKNCYEGSLSEITFDKIFFDFVAFFDLLSFIPQTVIYQHINFIFIQGCLLKNKTLQARAGFLTFISN